MIFRPKFAVQHVMLMIVASIFSMTPLFGGQVACQSSPTVACLDNGRYQVEVSWASGLDSGQGQVLASSATDTAFFTLGDADTAETMVRVDDNCLLNSFSWVYINELSRNQVDITVTDTDNGNVRQYVFNEGFIHQPVIDSEGIACAPQPFKSAASHSSLQKASSQLRLINNRFHITVDWDLSAGGGGVGTPIPLTDSSGAFWLFSPSEGVRTMKIEPNTQTGFYRFTTSSVSSVRQMVRVVDSCSGNVQVYDFTEGVVLAIEDGQMHPIECDGFLFAEDFECGDLSPWSSSTP